MTLASKITLVRVLLIPVVMVFLYLSGGTAGNIWLWIALAVFIVASLSDYVDGHIARKYNQITDFGKFLDPLADKLLIATALIGFVELGRMPAWMAVIIIAREFIVTGLRSIAASKGVVIAAIMTGKVKTCIQIASCIIAFVFYAEPFVIGGISVAWYGMLISTLKNTLRNERRYICFRTF